MSCPCLVCLQILFPFVRLAAYIISVFAVVRMSFNYVCVDVEWLCPFIQLLCMMRYVSFNIEMCGLYFYVFLGVCNV